MDSAPNDAPPTNDNLVPNETSDSELHKVIVKGVIINTRKAKITRLELIHTDRAIQQEDPTKMIIGLSHFNGSEWKLKKATELSRSGHTSIRLYTVKTLWFRRREMVDTAELDNNRVYQYLEAISDKGQFIDYPFKSANLEVTLQLDVTKLKSPKASSISSEPNEKNKQFGPSPVNTEKSVNHDQTLGLPIQVPEQSHETAQEGTLLCDIKELAHTLRRLVPSPFDAEIDSVPEHKLELPDVPAVYDLVKRLGEDIKAFLQDILQDQNKIVSEKETALSVLELVTTYLSIMGSDDHKVRPRIVDPFNQRTARLRRNFDEHRNIRLPRIEYSFEPSPQDPLSDAPKVTFAGNEIGEGSEGSSITPAELKNDELGQILSVEAENRLLKDLQKLSTLGDPSSFFGNRARLEEMLEGTREGQIQQITEWRNNSKANLFLLLGGPGTGKTSISRSIWMGEKSSKRDSIALFLIDPKVDDAPCFWPNVALALAKVQPIFREKLCQALSASVDSLYMGDVSWTFEEIIVKPLKDAENDLDPMLVIVDGLGCSEGFREGARWNALLESIASWESKLHHKFKLFVTARPHPSISDALLSGKETTGHLELFSGKQCTASDRQDLHKFLTHKFAKLNAEKSKLQESSVSDMGLASIPWPPEHILTQLADDCAGSFLWANAIVEFITVPSADGSRDDRLKKVASQGHKIKFRDIDAMYDSILESNFSGTFPNEFHAIIGTIAALNDSLTITDISSLISSNESKVEEICHHMYSIISIDQATRISLRHPSFTSYIVDPKRFRHSTVNLDQSHGHLALSCLQTMRDQLHFNVYGLTSSYTHINMIKPVTEPLLMYACRFWADHMHMSRELRESETKETLGRDTAPPVSETQNKRSAIPADQRTNYSKTEQLDQKVPRLARGQTGRKELQPTARSSKAATESPKVLDLIKSDLFGKDRWLYWLEVMSALNRVDDACRMLAVTSEWLNVGGEKELATTAAEASRFVSTFRDPITFSPAHIYISAVPFYEFSSSHLKSRHLSARIPNSIHASNHEGVIPKSPLQFSFKRPSGKVESDSDINSWNAAIFSLALSPDQKHVAAGFGDGSLCLFEISTGMQVMSVRGDGMDSEVMVLVFSTKGVIAGSYNGSLRIWNLDDGSQVGETIQAHRSCVLGLAISPDETQIVTSSDDRTLRIFDVKDSGIKPFLGPLKGHTDDVWSVAWIPSVAANDKSTNLRVVSGSSDSTIRVWSALTGQSLNPPMEHHSPVMAVASDFEGKRIVSGGTNDIILWEIQTGNKIWIFRGQSIRAWTLNFSRNGKQIFGSYDDSITVWNAANGLPLFQPFKGFSTSIYSVWLLPNNRIISCDYDGFIKVWDMPSESSLETSNNPPGISCDIMGIMENSDMNAVVCTDGRQYWRWNLLTGLPTGGVLTGESSRLNGVRCVDLSLDGLFIAVGADYGACVHNISTGQRTEHHTPGDLGLQVGAKDVNFSHDGEKIIILADDSSLFSWPLCSPEEPASMVIRSDSIVANHGKDSPVHVIRISHNDKMVATGAENGTICVWDVETANCIGRTIKEHEGCVNVIAFSPDDTHFASASELDKNLLIWSLETEKFVHRHASEHEFGSIKWLDWSPSGKLLVTGGSDQTIRIVEVTTGQTISGPFYGHEQTITAVAFSNDGLKVISGAKDGTVRLWNIAPTMLSRLSRQTYHEDCVNAIAISPDSSLVASGGIDREVVLHHINQQSNDNEKNFTVLKFHEDDIVCIAFSPDGNFLFTGSYDGALGIWDCNAPGKPQSDHTIEGLRAFAIAGKGHQIACGTAAGAITLHNIVSRQLAHVQTLNGHSSKVNAVAYFPDTLHSVVSAGEDGMVYVWKTSKSEPVRTIKAHDGLPVLSVAVTPDRRIVSAGRDKIGRIWSEETGQLLATLEGHESIIHAIGIHTSQDGSQIVTGSRDCTIRVWDSKTGQQLCPPASGHDGEVRSVAFSADGKTIASGSADNTVTLWKVDPEPKMKRPEMSWTRHKMVGQKTPSVRTVDKMGNVLDGISLDSGWASRRNGPRLFWVPPALRTGLCFPPQIGVIGTQELYLDFGDFVHGEEWEKCWKDLEKADDTQGTIQDVPTRIKGASATVPELGPTVDAENLKKSDTDASEGLGGGEKVEPEVPDESLNFPAPGTSSRWNTNGHDLLTLLMRFARDKIDNVFSLPMLLYVLIGLLIGLVMSNHS